MSVFALSVREQRRAPQPAAGAARLSRDDLHRVLLALGIALVFSVALVFSLLSLPVPQQDAPIAAPHVTKPAWVEIAKPLRLFALATPDWGRAPTSYTAQRHRDGAGRRDNLTFGTFGTDQPWLHLTLYRLGADEALATPFFVDMARRAAPAGLAVARMGQPAPLPTRFGTFEVADFTLAGQVGAAGSGTQCLGFRLPRDKVLQIGGFACGAPGQPVSRQRLACTLDRIDLISAGDDTDLRGFFTGAPIGPGPACNDSRPVTAGQGSGPRQAEIAEPSVPAGGFTIIR
jgi:hypothetical protein